MHIIIIMALVMSQNDVYYYTLPVGHDVSVCWIILSHLLLVHATYAGCDFTHLVPWRLFSFYKMVVAYVRVACLMVREISTELCLLQLCTVLGCFRDLARSRRLYI